MTFMYGANVNANGIRQHYLRYGGAGPALVLIPGITSPAVTWGFVAERLGRNFDTYVLDVRGRGLSETGDHLDYDIDTCADDIIAFANVLGLNDYRLVGHSMGGRFAIRAAACGAAGLQKMVLIDPPVSGPDRREYPGKPPWYVDSIRDCAYGAGVETMRKYCPTWSLKHLRLRAEWLHTCNEKAILDSLKGFNEDDIHSDLPRIGIPTLLIVAGQGDVIRSEEAEEILELMPSIKIERVPDVGHMIPWDDYEAFFSAFGTFLGPKL